MVKHQVFDESGDLRDLAVAVGFTDVTIIAAGVSADDEAARLLLHDPHWRIAFVHMLDGAWNKLCEGLARRDQIIVRFSSQGFPASQPEGKHALCLRCRVRIRDIRESDLVLLRDALPSCASDLRQRLVPASLRHLISFAVPYHLRALHLISRAILATWGSDTTCARSGEARCLLGVEYIPPLPGDVFNTRESLWRWLRVRQNSDESGTDDADNFAAAVASELGVTDIKQCPMVYALIVDIFKKEPKKSISDQILVEAYVFMESYLRRYDAL